MTAASSQAFQPSGLSARVLRADPLTDLAATLQRLHDTAPDIGVTGHWSWIRASMPQTDPRVQPWAVVVERDDDVVAAAVLVDDTRGAVRQTTLAGSSERHRGQLAAIDEHAAISLGAALADALLDGVREFELGPIRPGTCVEALLDRLPVPTILDEVDIPSVCLSGDPSLGMSAGVRRTLRKSLNRASADRLTPRTETAATSSEILPMLPLLEHISRERDYAAGRPSPLDDAHRCRLWRRRIQAIAATGMLRLATLWFDDELAAYVLGVDEGSTYRVLEGRYVGHWARYAPGRLLEAAVLEAAAARSECTSFDWMTDIAPNSLLAKNSAERLVVVRGRT